MSSRNSRRAPQNLEEPLPNTTEPEAPPQVQEVAQHTTSTELVDLPSEGRFYPKDHPLHNKDSVEIRYMTARDEDILTSPSLLRKGVAIDRFMESIIVTPGVEVGDLLVGDKSAIMIAARITGYGPDYSANVVCPECRTEFEHDFDVKEVRQCLQESPGLVVLDNPLKNVYPMPLTSKKKDDVFVGRIRRDFTKENCIQLWVVSDNLRKGAATNTVQIAEYLIRKKLL